MPRNKIDCFLRLLLHTYVGTDGETGGWFVSSVSGELFEKGHERGTWWKEVRIGTAWKVRRGAGGGGRMGTEGGTEGENKQQSQSREEELGK